MAASVRPSFCRHAGLTAVAAREALVCRTWPTSGGKSFLQNIQSNDASLPPLECGTVGSLFQRSRCWLTVGAYIGGAHGKRLTAAIVKCLSSLLTGDRHDSRVWRRRLNPSSKNSVVGKRSYSGPMKSCRRGRVCWRTRARKCSARTARLSRHARHWRKRLHAS